MGRRDMVRTSKVAGQNKQTLPVGESEGDEGGVSEDLQDEGLQVGQLESVGEPGLPCPANHCVCIAQKTKQGLGHPDFSMASASPIT